jgi:hypothetical protein
LIFPWPHPVQTLLAGGYVPVIAPIAIDMTHGYHLLNVNADTAAGAVAAAPDDEPGQVRPQPAEIDTDDAEPWYRRLGRAIADLFDEGA